MKTLIVITIVFLAFAGKGAIYNTIKIQETHNQEISKALSMLDK